MRLSAFWLRSGMRAAAALLVVIVWASAAVAGPGAKHCRLARGWVQSNCGSVAAREGKPTQCVKARAWLEENCPARIALSSKPAYRLDVSDDEDDEEAYADDDDDDEVTYVPPPRHRKRVHRVRRRVVHAYVARRARSAYRYRAPRYRDKVFLTDYRRLRGQEKAFYGALDNDGY